LAYSAGWRLQQCFSSAPARLHNPDYDFPDDLIGIGTEGFVRLA
jgi:hypothetical protein